MFKERRGQRQYKTSSTTTIACACNLDYQLVFDKSSYQVMLLLITATFYNVLVLQAAAKVQLFNYGLKS